MSQSKTDKTISILAIVGSLVALNVLGLYVFGRLDLTADNQFTLSDATKDTLAGLKEPVTVRAYFTEDLPPQLQTVSRYVRDLLEEYYSHGSGNFRYEFIDPVAEETAEDKEKKKDVKVDFLGRQVREATSVEKELQTFGIPPVEVRVNENDKLELKKGYMGLVIKFGDKHETIPVVQDTTNLEYDLTTFVRKLSREKSPKLAFVTPNEASELQKEIGKIYGLLSQNFDVSMLDLSTQTEIAEDIDAIVVLAGVSPYGDAQKRAIDSYLAKGRSAAFLLDTIKPDLQTLETKETNHGLNDLLASYGVTLENGLALDAECATINIARQLAFMRVAEPVRYPFIPVAKSLNNEHPLARGLGQIPFPFSTPLKLTLPEGSDVKGDVVARTSEKGWLATPPFDLNPKREWTMTDVGEFKQLDLMVTLAGPVKSPYGGEGNPGTRILVAGGSGFLSDQFLGQGTAAMVLNLVDWLVLDEALLAVRSRGLAAAPLAEIDDGQRAAIKWGNILGLPLAFVAFGLVRWRRREASRGKVTV